MDKPNDFRSLWLATPVSRRRDIAAALRTSYPYLQRIAGGFARPSLDMALQMAKHFPGMDLSGFHRAEAMAGKRVRQ